MKDPFKEPTFTQRQKSIIIIFYLGFTVGLLAGVVLTVINRI